MASALLHAGEDARPPPSPPPPLSHEDTRGNEWATRQGGCDSIRLPKQDGHEEADAVTLTAAAEKRVISEQEKECALVTEDIHTLLADDNDKISAWNKMAAEGVKLRAEARAEEAELLRLAGGGRDGGGGGGGGDGGDMASGAAVALHEAVVGILEARLAAAGPSPARAFEAIEAMAARKEGFEACTRRHNLEKNRRSPGLSDANANTNAEANDNLGSSFQEDRVRSADGRQARVDERLKRLQRVLRTLEAREVILGEAVKEARADVRRLWALSFDRAKAKAAAEKQNALLAPVLHDEPAAAAAPTVETAPPSPANSVYDRVQDWEAGEMRDACLKRARGTGIRNDAFIADRVLKEDEHWMVKMRKLGEGSFGCVWAMWVPTLDITFAMKTFSADAGDGGHDSSDATLSRICMITEMAVLNQIPPHPHLARAVAMDDTDRSDMRILYELGVGDLEAHALGLTSMSLSELLRLVAEAGIGLSFMHEHKYVHNDVKAANILVFSGESGTASTAKVADFGLAAAVGDVRYGQGTLGSKPPEAMRDPKPLCRPDQDTFGVGHLFLLATFKQHLKRHNIFASPPGITPEDARLLATMDTAEWTKYMDNLTYRNMTDPRFRGMVINADNLCSELGDMRDEIIETAGRATSPDPAQRPSMLELVEAIKSVSDRLLQKEQTSLAAATTAEDGAPPAIDTLTVAAVTNPSLPGVVELPTEEETARFPEVVVDAAGLDSHGATGSHVFAAFAAAPAAAAAAVAIPGLAVPAATHGAPAATLAIPAVPAAVGAIPDVQGPAQAPAVPLFAGVAAGLDAFVPARRAAGVAPTHHRGSTRHALAPRGNMPPSPPSPPAERHADGVQQAAQGGRHAPCWGKRDSNGSDACGNSRGGGRRYGGGAEGYATLPSAAWEGNPVLRSPQQMGFEGDGGRGYGATAVESPPQRYWGEGEGVGVGGRGRVGGGGWVAEGGWGGGTGWGGGAYSSPRHVGEAVTTAVAPQRHHQQYYQHQHHQQARVATESATRAQRYVAARETSIQTRRSEWRATEGGGDSRGSGSGGSSSRGSGGCTSGSGGNGGVATFRRWNNRRSRGHRSRRSGLRPTEGSESSGVSRRHHYQPALQETNAARRPVCQGGGVAAMGGPENATTFVAAHPAAARAVHAPTAAAAVVGGGGFGGGGGRGGFCNGGGGGGGRGGGRRWHGGGGYIPAPPCAASPAGYGNGGRCVPVAPPHWPVAACEPFASQATAVGAAGYYPGKSPYGGQAGYSRHTNYGTHAGYGGPAGYAGRTGYANRRG